MAFGQGLITLPTITGSPTDVPVLLTNGCFAANAIDGGSLSLANGGGSLRFYTDDTKVTRLACDVVEFVVGASPSIQVWVKVPTASTGATIYVEEDPVETSQPAAGADFGRNSVYTREQNSWHLNEAANTAPGGYKDSTGLSDATGFNMSSNSEVAFGQGTDFNGSNTKIHAGSSPVSALDTYSIEVWIKLTAAQRGDIYSEGDSTTNIRYSRLSVNESSGTDDNISYTTRGSTSTAIASSADVNITDGLAHKIVVNQISNTSREIYFDNTLVASNTDDRGSNTTLDIQTVGCLRRTSDALFYDGAAQDVKTYNIVKSANLRTAEYENQNSPDTWASMGAWTEQSGGGSDTTIAVTSAQQLTQAQLLSPTQLNNINVIVAESLASAQLINIASTLSVAAVNAEQKTQGNIAAIATINQLTTVITEQKTQGALVTSDNNQLISAVQAQQLTQALQINVTSDGAQDVNVVITEQKTQTQALIVSELSNIKLVICEQIAQSINSAVAVDSSVSAITAEQLTNAVTVTVDESSGLFVTVVQTEQLAHASTVNSQVNALVVAVVLEQLTQYNTQKIDIDLTISPVVVQQLTQAELVNIIVSNIAYELNIDIDQVTLQMLTPTYHIELLTPIYIIDQLH